MRIPSQLINLLDNWLSNRSAYRKVNKINSEFFEVNFGSIPLNPWSLFLALLLFALFISPFADITTPKTYADDNYLFGKGKKHSNAASKKLKLQ